MKKAINISNLLLLGFFLLGVSLLFSDQISTAALLITIGLSFLVFYVEGLYTKPLTISICFLIPSILILPRLIGFFTGDQKIAANELLRCAPLLILFLPFLYSKLDTRISKRIETAFFYGLLFGIICFMIICNYNVINKMISGNEPLEYFFRWRHLNVNYVKPIGTHPPYVGMIAIWVLVKTFYNKNLRPINKLVISLLLALFLFQLLARNSIIVALLVVSFVGISKLNYKYILTGALVFVTLFIVIRNHPHDYLREKFFYKLNPLNEEYKDKRLYRLEASYNVFKQAKFFGVGPGNDNTLRVIEYEKMGYMVAKKRRYNSHNQFFEYLVCYGIFGLLCFLITLAFLLQLTIKKKITQDTLLIISFIIACMSESVLERSLGIKYFSIFSLLIILNAIGTKKISNNR